jgi:hypothetical protein
MLLRSPLHFRDRIRLRATGSCSFCAAQLPSCLLQTTLEDSASSPLLSGSATGFGRRGILEPPWGLLVTG